MALIPGTRLGPYAVSAKIGEGGMGEVYQAKDTKLDRDVALKVLPEAFTADPDRLARFEREAKVLASLNHPNIGTIYGLEEAEGVKALVLELIEGPTLADRIKQGPIPVDEALPIAKQIAEALEAAHEAGVIHRDLKPANIKIKDDGTAKVLDFGLAKALEPDAGGAPSESPTMIATATDAGMIMGTAAYMSPEQAKGTPVDTRTDLWALGVVLLEMLTGQQAFAGPTVSESLAQVLERGPDLDSLPRDTPTAVRRLLRRCLAKNRRERLQHAGDARVELGEAMAGPESNRVVASDASPSARYRGWQVAGIVALAVGLAFAAGRWMSTEETSATKVRRLALPINANQRAFGHEPSRRFAISPAGDTVVIGASPSLGEPLLRRDLDSVDAVPIPGTERGEAPFFSPDGRWLGFYRTTEGTLLRVSLAGGEPEVVGVSAGALAGVSWGPDDTIVFASSSSQGLMRVPAAGGTPEPLTTMVDDEGRHEFPHHLPGGNRLLFTIDEPGDLPRIVAVSTVGRDRVDLGLRGREPRYLSVGAAGYLVYGQSEGLVAVPFDPETLEVKGVPVSVLAPVHMDALGHVHAVFATDGTAVSLEPRSEGSLTPMWVERDGSTRPVEGIEQGDYREVRLSPDGRRVALSDQVLSISVRDLQTNELFTPDFVGGAYPRWNPQGTRLVFSTNRLDRFQIYAVDIPDTSPSAPLLATDEGGVTGSWSSDGETMFFYTIDAESNRDLHAYDFDDGGVTPLLETADNEKTPMVSPDGRWLAYLSDASGRHEVYVSSLPDFDVTRQVSRDGAAEPSWSASGDELFYRSGRGAMVALTFSATPEINLGAPRELFRDVFLRDRFGNTGYSVTSDGRFLMLGETEASSQLSQLHVTLGFADEVQRLVSETQ